MNWSNRTKRSFFLVIGIALCFVILGTSVFAAALSDSQGRDYENRDCVPFSDVSPDDWYYEACEYVSQKGIFNGMDDGMFAPQKQMTCAMFLQALANNTENYEEGFFSREIPDTWYDDAVGWACCVNLIRQEAIAVVGEPMTRERAAELMYQYAVVTGQRDLETVSGKEGESVSEDLGAYYSDADQISESAIDAVLWCTQRGIVQGDGERFLPKSVFTRAETAQLFQNAEILLKNAKTCTIGYFEASDVKEILFQNGSNGVKYVCADQETIESIVDQLNAFRYDEITRRPFSDGWDVLLEIYGRDGEELWSALPGQSGMTAPYRLNVDEPERGYTYSYHSNDEGCLSELYEKIKSYVPM